MSTNQIERELLQFVASLPTDSNPYVALKSHIKALFLPTVPNSALVQLYVLATLLGATLLLVVVSLLIRAKKGIFWVYQLSHSPTLIRPHFSISWSLIACVMLILFVVYIAHAANLFRHELNRSVGYWATLVWTSAWVGGALATHSLGVSFLLQAAASRPSSSLRAWTLVANLCGTLSPMLYLGLMLPLGILTGRRFEAAISTYFKIDDVLQAASANWTPGTKLSIVSLAPALPLVDVVAAQQDSLFRAWRTAFLAYAVTAFILVTVLVTIGLLHLSSLRRSFQQSQRDLAGSATDSAGRAARLQVQQTWRTLVMTVAAFSLLGSIFVAVAVFSALNPTALQRSTSSQIVTLVPLWAFALLGFPTAVSLVWRAWEAHPSETGRSQDTKRSGLSFSGSDGAGTRKFSIELAGRSKERMNRSATSSRGLDVRLEPFPPGGVNVTVEVAIEEDGGESDEKYPPSSAI